MMWAGAHKTIMKEPWTECERYRLRKSLTKRTLCCADDRNRSVCLDRKSGLDRREGVKMPVIDPIAKVRHHPGQWRLGRLRDIIIYSIAQPASPNLNPKLPRIQTPNLRTLPLPLKHKLTQQLPRRRPILNPPTSMPSPHQQALHTRLANKRPTPPTNIRQITRLSRRNLSIPQLLGDSRDLVENLLTLALIALHEVCGCG